MAIAHRLSALTRLWPLPCAVFALIGRRPEAVVTPQFVWEEAGVFWAATFTLDPFRYLVEQWAGYIQVLPRAAFLVARLGPPEIAPVVTILIHGLAIGLVAAFLASDRLAEAIPDSTARYAFALAIPLLPEPEPYLSVLNAHWFLALYLVGLALATGRRWYDYPAAAIAILSGIAAVVAVPVLLVRRDRLAIVAGACAAVQVVSVLTSDRQAVPVEPMAVIEGSTVVFLVLGIAIACAGALPRPTVLAFGFLGLATLAAGALSLGDRLQYPLNGGRYFLALAAAIALIAAASFRRPLGTVLAAVMIVATLYQFRLPSFPDTDWPEHARCIGGPNPCVVPIAPAEWSVTWPGSPAEYVVPPFPR